MVQQRDLCDQCDRGKHLAVQWHHCHLFRDGMLDYFQTLMEKMSFQFGAAGHYHRSFPPPSNTSAKQDDARHPIAGVITTFLLWCTLPPAPQFVVLTPDVTTWHAWYQVPWLRPVIHPH